MPLPEDFDNYDFIMRYETQGVTHEELVEGFQRLINTGLAWQLQGTYGRTAQALIDAGECSA